LNFFNMLLFIVFAVTVDVVCAPLAEFQFSEGSSRDGFIAAYFRLGYSYKDIVLFLATLHGMKIGVPRLKQILYRLGLRRRVEHTQETVAAVLQAVQHELEESGMLMIANRVFLN